MNNSRMLHLVSGRDFQTARNMTGNKGLAVEGKSVVN